MTGLYFVRDVRLVHYKITVCVDEETTKIYLKQPIYES